MSKSVKELKEKFNNYSLQEDKRQYFYHYTFMENAIDILESGCFRLSKLKFSNDLKEKQRDIYYLSFCATHVDDVPMWYLYAGIDGKGAKLRFSKGKIKNIIESLVFSTKENEKYNMKVKDYFDVECNYVLYKDVNNDYRYRGEKYQADKSINQFIKKNKFYVKNIMWRSENEFRIIFKLKNGKNLNSDFIYIKYTDAFHIFDSKNDNFYKERKDFYKKGCGISLFYGPETDNQEVNKTINLIYKEQIRRKEKCENKDIEIYSEIIDAGPKGPKLNLVRKYENHNERLIKLGKI